ncbi:MAG: PAS domain-containing protein [Thioalkalivibrionaceae bacterium]
MPRRIDPDLLLLAIDASQDGIVIAEREGSDTILIYVNAAFERLTGYRAEDILFQDCRFLQGEDRNQPARAEIRKALAKNKPCRVRLRNYRKDGSLFWNELSITPIQHPDDGITYYVGVQKDISDLVAALERLEALETAASRALKEPPDLITTDTDHASTSAANTSTAQSTSRARSG